MKDDAIRTGGQSMRAMLRLHAVLIRSRELAAPFFDLWLRICLAQSLLNVAMLGAMRAGPHGIASWQSVLNARMGAGEAMLFGVQLDVACALLMMIGLFTRPIAAIFLAMIVIGPRPDSDRLLFEVALLVWYLLQGAAGFSIDRLLTRGLASSALPLVPGLIRAAQWLSRYSRPIYLTLLRLWLSAAILKIDTTSHMVPLQTFGVPSIYLVPIAAMLLIGVLTPVLSSALILATLGATAMMPAAGLNGWAALALLPLALHGAGPLSVDRLLLAWLRHNRSRDEELAHVVIVGAGFGGMACAMRLRFAAVRVTLIDKRNFHLFQPLLYQVATASLSPADIATPVREVFRHEPGIRVLRETVTGVDTLRHEVVTDAAALSYDYLVLASGASHGYFGHEQWSTYAPGLKTIEDALEIRRRVLDAFEKAESAPSRQERARLMTFVVCGGGPTGVEMAGALAELSRLGLQHQFRSIDPAQARIILIQSGERLLPAFATSASRSALQDLERLGVEVLLKSRVESIDDQGVVVAGARIDAGVVVWAAGVIASPAAHWLGVAADEAGRIHVAADLSVAGLEHVYAVGDTAAAQGAGGKMLPGVAPAAKQGGEYVARAIIARIEGRSALAPFRYRHQGNLATIGRKAAVIDFGTFAIRGALAWWLWGGVHVFFLLGARNRLSVTLGWLWNYFTFDASAQLITHTPAMVPTALPEAPTPSTTLPPQTRLIA